MFSVLRHAASSADNVMLPLDEPFQDSRHDNLGPIFLNEVPGIWYGDALGIRDRRR